MKLAIISDIHNNEARLSEALSVCKKEGIKTCICCGDIASADIVNLLSGQFDNVYAALGNMDFNLKSQTQTLPENVEVSTEVLEKTIDGLRIAIVHHDYKTLDLAKDNKYDFIFYGHTHTPWVKKIGETTLINPGEIAGERGKATFAIFDTKLQAAKLEPLK